MIYEVTIDNKKYGIDVNEETIIVEDREDPFGYEANSDADQFPDFDFEEVEEHNVVCSPMQGKIIKITVTQGQAVKKDEVMAVLESMKMEINIYAPDSGTVNRINISEGSFVKKYDELFNMEIEG